MYHNNNYYCNNVTTRVTTCVLSVVEVGGCNPSQLGSRTLFGEGGRILQYLFGHFSYNYRCFLSNRFY